MRFPTATQLAKRREQEILDGYYDDLSDDEFEAGQEAWDDYMFEACESLGDKGE